MNTQIKYLLEQNFNQFNNSLQNGNNFNFSQNQNGKIFSNKQFNKSQYHKAKNHKTTKKQKHIFTKTTIIANDISSLDTDYSYHKSTTISPKQGTKKENENLVLKKSNKFVDELFKTFADNNSLCNFSIFEKSIGLELKPDKNILNKMTLNEYFECFEEPSFMCLNVPYLDKKGNINFNVFNPTLSSMNLLIKTKSIKEEKINKKYIINNFSLNITSKDLINIEFDESNPPYNRDIIGTKINIIHKILGAKKIFISDIDINNSYFSILWTPADTHKFKSSFLSFYTFNFRTIGTLIIKMEDISWFTIFCEDINIWKDFKKDYINKVNEVKNYIKKSHNINDADNLDNQLFSHDYRRFLYIY